MPADVVIRGWNGVRREWWARPPRRRGHHRPGDRGDRPRPPRGGSVELDASGCVVAPGFIDIHTHFDAQVFWDPELKPSSYHGVTTVVAGNCGFSIAPCRPEHHDVIVHTLENVEGMDADSLSAGHRLGLRDVPGLPRSGTSSGDQPQLHRLHRAHRARLYVMGDAAYERAATTDEIERMCQLVDEAMDVGAAGLSTSFSFAHRGVDGKPVPSRFAEMDEVEALFMAVGEGGQGGGPRHSRAGSASTPTSSPGSRGSDGRSPARCSPCRAGSTVRSSNARGGPGPGGRRLAAGHAAPADHAVHPGRRLQPQRRRVFGELIKVSPEVRKSGLPRPGVADAGLRRPGAQRRRYEAALGDLRGLGVGAVPRPPGPTGHRHRP
jgi:hypothetical protein